MSAFSKSMGIFSLRSAIGMTNVGLGSQRKIKLDASWSVAKRYCSATARGVWYLFWIILAMLATISVLLEDTHSSDSVPELPSILSCAPHRT